MNADRDAHDLRGWRTHDEELLNVLSPNAPSIAELAPEHLHWIQREIEDALAELDGIEPAVSVFGSARLGEDHPAYIAARELSRRLAKRGITVITGGGPGVMAAANRGIHDVGGHSVGLTIELPFEEAANQWCDLDVHFRYFFTRKLMFVRYASAFVVHPGGFGTMDELFEALTLIQTDKIHAFPVILVGSEFWNPMVTWAREQLLAMGTISQGDLDLLHVTDDLDEVCTMIEEAIAAERRTGASGTS